MSSKFVYHDSKHLAAVLQGFLALGIALMTLQLALLAREIRLIDRDAFTSVEGHKRTSRLGAVGRANGVVLGITFIAFGIWIVRGNRNVRALGALDLDASPGWAVGSFFV